MGDSVPSLRHIRNLLWCVNEIQTQEWAGAILRVESQASLTPSHRYLGTIRPAFGSLNQAPGTSLGLPIFIWDRAWLAPSFLHSHHHAPSTSAPNVWSVLTAHSPWRTFFPEHMGVACYPGSQHRANAPQASPGLGLSPGSWPLSHGQSGQCPDP